MAEDSPKRWTVDGKFFALGDERVSLQGLTYGPFSPDRADPSRLTSDLQWIADHGFNTIRTYHQPEPALLDGCEELGLKLLLTLPWECHTDFYRKRETIYTRCSRSVEQVAGRSCILGYLVSNEIPGELVRWIGPMKVLRFLEKLIRTCRAIDPGGLFSYANYPTTEYLNPRNADFLAFNLYLEDRPAFRDYIQRLHNQAGNLPLVLAEFGLDTRRNGEEKQRETLLWEAEEAEAAGVAGNVVYAYTDEWFNAGVEVQDWSFGLVRKDRTEKPAAPALASWLKNLPQAPEATPEKLPMVSVVVCSRNGHAYLPDCLKSLRKLDYPNLDLLLIDDGSSPPLNTLAEDCEGVRVIRQEHRGLSAARNLGFAEAKGEIVAYTDDDCVVDCEWVTRLVTSLTNNPWDAVGGPNIPPPTPDPIKRSLGLAPGNPVQVLLSDNEAEHLPGCNFAVTRRAFSALGGFSDRYRTAGDDVDFCWRLRDSGFQIGYDPTAFVWHHPRSKIGAYLRQQKGYGQAEALLMDDHPKRFARSGGALWAGRVYQHSPSWELGGTPIIYHGRFGNALFQSVQGQRWEGLTRWKDLVLSWPWIAVALSLLVFGFLLPGLAFLGLIALVLTVAFGLDQARNVAVRHEDRKPLSFAILTGLQCVQPALRQAARIFHQSPRPEQRPIYSSTLSFWNPNGVSRETWLEGLQTRLPAGGGKSANLAPGRGWDFWDFPLPDSPFCQFRVSTTSEAHDGPARLNRLRTDAWVFPVYRWLALWTGGLAIVLFLAGNWLISLLVGLLILTAWALIRAHAGGVLAPTLTAARTEAAAFEFTELDEHEQTPENA